MRTKRTSNNVRPVELPPLFHRGTRTPNIERRHDGLNFIFDVGSSEFDVRCFRSSRHSQRGLQPSRASGIGNPNSELRTPNSELRTPNSQRGVALIITLILLSVVTFMAITFLALSRRERSAVATVTDTASARLAADAALANAEAQVIANVLATANPYNFSLLVSTNGWPLNFTNLPRDLTNLYVSPRAPVLISTNEPLGRFYLDLNRNGRYDTNGWVANVDNNNIPLVPSTILEIGDPEWIGVLERPDAPYGPNNKFVARYAFIAVPVGNTLDLNAIHNQAHVPPRPPAVPVNWIVNPPSGGQDSFIRNEGVGSWEINLAAFLVDLNTNEWDGVNPYQYNPNPYNPPVAFTCPAFDDARAILAYRYNLNLTTLASVKSLYGNSPPLFNATTFGSDHIDGYTYGQPLFGTTGFQLPPDNDSLLNSVPNGFPGGSPWVGADNTNHFFSHQDLFNTSDTALGVPAAQMALNNYFTYRLLQAGTNTFGGSTVPTYDRYTFYRLLSQLGTDSAPESGKMNLNYDNVNPYLNGFPNTNGVAASTNFVAWQPLAFFTNAADRLLRAYTTHWRNSNPTNFAATFYSVTNFNFNESRWTTNYPAFGIGNIPVLVSNRFVYSPAVNRLLQLAANIYDATTNNTFALGNNYPSVFRPLFSRDANAFGVAGLGPNVFISGYTNVFSVTGTSDSQLDLPIDVADLSTVSGQVINLATNVYGVPWIIGAKKGFPNFNELAMENAFQLTRKLQVTRANTNADKSTYSYNQMFLLNLTNQLGVECWNSYTGNYTNGVMIYATEYLKSIILTNDEGFGINLSTNITGVLSVNNWPGYNLYTPNPSFQIPLNTIVISITNSMYRFNTPGTPYLTTNLALPYESNVVVNGSSYPQPHWWLMLTNELRVIMLDTNVVPYRVIDYVQLRGPNSIRDLTAEIQASYDKGTGINDLWDTTTNKQGIPTGLANQIGVSLGTSTSGSGWDTTDLTQREKEIDGFRVFYHLPPTFFPNGNYGIDASTNSHQVPYTPTANAVQHISWQANDPLVHYISDDLNWSGASYTNSTFSALTDENLGVLNQRYWPWGVNPGDQNPYYPGIKDPLVRRSDDWDFPANKFPTVGWLGRVHRGTPWQTVYLKASDVLVATNIIGIGTNVWMVWTGNRNMFDATNAAPVHDRLLFDLFTTAFNDNATRGQLSVNVGGTKGPSLAAWSALFSGVVVPTNTIGGYTIIQPAGPAGPSSLLGGLVTDINSTRATFTNSDGLVGTFEHVGDILATPELTVSNQWILLNNSDTTNGISDEMYEWLPQQTMSLLRVSGSPRYVIYCYGQALKPAPNSIVTSGPLFGMVANYQVVSEIATRAVVRFNSTVTNVIKTDGINWFGQPVVTNNNAVIESFNILPPD
jgi:hypothetical protein